MLQFAPIKSSLGGSKLVKSNLPRSKFPFIWGGGGSPDFYLHTSIHITDSISCALEAQLKNNSKSYFCGYYTVVIVFLNLFLAAHRPQRKFSLSRSFLLNLNGPYPERDHCGKVKRCDSSGDT